ncbi:MAG: DNA replication/repair protein RecF [Micrococcales bacterium]|nr:MAG: DNA replication/repair protein RecF [Micrococcales bacterium]PIE27027.1 MAG: DNA replication/repair protein RecF [Micrococcales bacterium]
MLLNRLYLADFRNYRAADLEFGPGVTTLVGNNGQGKTNLVEAVGFLATQSSHRVATPAPLIRHGAQQAIVRAGTSRDGRDLSIQLSITPGQPLRAMVNKSAMPRARDALGLLRVVVFAPEDLSLVKGDPQSRRRFLDDLLVVRAPRFAAVRSEYDRVLKQRNSLLRNLSGRIDATGEATLQVWDEQLAGYGAQLLEARFYLLAQLAPLVAQAYEQVSDGGGTALLGYRCSVCAELSVTVTEQLAAAATGNPQPTPGRGDIETAIRARLVELRDKEAQRGLTLVGPHRDDVELRLGELPTKGYASHGESWSFALSLKLASFNLLQADADTQDGEPVLVLDDVFAELDASRRARLAEQVGTAGQVLITAAVRADIPGELTGRLIRIEAGGVLDDEDTAQSGAGPAEVRAWS